MGWADASVLRRAWRHSRDLVQAVLLAGRGRPVAVGLLLCLLVLLQWPQHSPFRPAQLALFDYYQQTFPRQPQSQPVTVVEIDEQSLRQLGQWPWPRNRLATLLDAINAHGPLAIGLDLYMPERDQTSPAQVAANLPPSQAELARQLRELLSHEQALVESMRAAPVVLGAAGFDFPTLSTSRGLRSVPVNSQGLDPQAWLRHYPWVLASLPELQSAARGQAVLSVDLDGGVVRRLPLVLSVNGQAVPSLAMEMLRVATAETAISMRVERDGIQQVSVADLSVPTQPNGEIWLPFAAASLQRSVSAAEVLAGRFDPSLFENKLVLIGMTGFGLADMRSTPLNAQLPGVEIQAQLLESLIERQFLQRPRWMPWLETLLLLAGGLLLIWAVPHMRARWASLLAGILFLLLFSSGFALFKQAGLLFDAASIFASLNIVFGSLLSSVFVETDRQRRLAEAQLQVQREEAARVAGELAAARRIQLGSLPNPQQLFAAETRFELAAMLEPAREVGGDLYDCFMLDSRRLFFLIGDVSGKGLPASLFMVVTKALGKSAALRAPVGLAQIVATLGEELARENPEMLFVTLIAGVLDVESGALQLINAGHDAPWLRHAGERWQRMQGEGGPPLCIVDGMDYPEQSHQLQTGDMLCLITDGVSEATNQANQLYGIARCEQLLQQQAGSCTPQQLCNAIWADVHRFMAAAPASDDLTLLSLRWHGPGSSTAR